MQLLGKSRDKMTANRAAHKLLLTKFHQSLFMFSHTKVIYTPRVTALYCLEYTAEYVTTV